MTETPDKGTNIEEEEDVDILPPLSADFEYMRSPNVDRGPKGPTKAASFLQSESKRRLSQDSLCSYEMQDVLNMVGVEAKRAANQREELRKKSAIIRYEPTDSWFSTPMRAWHVDHNRKIVFIFLLFNTVVVLLARFTNFCGVVQEDVPEHPNRFCNEDSWIFMEDHVLSAISFGLFLLMAFRANNAYDRFWEARTAWTSIGGTSRDITSQICYQMKISNEKDKLELGRIVGFIGAIPNLLKLKLRNENNCIPELGEILSTQDIMHIESAKDKPQFCIDVIRYYLTKKVAEGKFTDAQVQSMNQTSFPTIQSFIGTSEKIRNQPLPIIYTMHLRFLIILWLIILPIHWVGIFGWYTIILATLADYAIVGMETMACEIEDPFGYDKADIDLDKICLDIVSRTQEIYKRAVHSDRKYVFEYDQVMRKEFLIRQYSKEEGQCTNTKSTRRLCQSSRERTSSLGSEDVTLQNTKEQSTGSQEHLFGSK
ncbi:hypothetical protein CTEN210_04605 [Chaetoceros tenuissimus]|uniref:Uncharacterized protein n=1 Tax=Chaetoceros tenuissimus TaxID=426638 RepID=A0AAD3CLY7_9STRA|nr:hypothetical protein CTEN210_04605 [Chaetoceros tenuissimus]